MPDPARRGRALRRRLPWVVAAGILVVAAGGSTLAAGAGSASPTSTTSGAAPKPSPAPKARPDRVDVQVAGMATAIRDGDAEHAAGGYYRGSGAFFAIDIVRGANSSGRAPEFGVRDWVISMLKALGPQLKDVPADESIGISARFYDYNQNRQRTLTVVTDAATVGRPETYRVTLDDTPIPSGQKPAPTPMPSVEPTIPAGTVFETFDDPAAVAKAWHTTGGTWTIADGAFTQTQATGLDRQAWFLAPIPADATIDATVRLAKGDMGAGAGILFNGPTTTRTAGAHMITYTLGGTYLKWGWFNPSGTFVFQGGTTVPTGADGQPHRIAAVVHGSTYDVQLDGRTLATDVPIVPARGSHVGLIDSLAQVAFDDLSVIPANAQGVAP
ncbi:MAG: hypothetical protein U0869_20685 [Chloroflexota bacterium]